MARSVSVVDHRRHMADRLDRPSPVWAAVNASHTPAHASTAAAAPFRA